MTKTKLQPYINAVAYIMMVAINVVAQRTPKTVADISNTYQTLLTPSGLTFAIWGLIYGTLFIYVVYQLFNEDRYNIGDLFLFSCLLNIAWIVTWHFEFILISLLVIMALAVVLFMIYERLKPAKLLMRIPFSIYYSWISIASIISIFTLLSSMTNIIVFDSTIMRVISVITLVLLVVLIYRYRKDVAYVGVFIWAYIGIIMKHVNVFQSKYMEIIIISFLMILVCIVTIIFSNFIKRKEIEI